MFTPTFSFSPVTDNSQSGPKNNKDRTNDDWRSYAIAASIALNNGFREASKRMVKQAREKVGLLAPGAYRNVAGHICDLINAADRRRLERAAALRQSIQDELLSISGNESVDLRAVLEQVLLHLRL